MRTAFRLLAIAFILAFAGHLSAGIPPEEATKHEGEIVKIEGVVVNVHTSGKGNVFLDFGGKYPKQAFTVYLPAAVAALWNESDLKSPLALTGKSVEVTGKIVPYKGKPEIVIETRGQVRP
jgi:DNA/RNA endonuclease YhcR with UshA esterase domain